MKALKDYTNPPQLTHLKRLTTKDGLIQHADHEVPDPAFGYSIDDNARALIACLWHYELFQDKSVLNLAEIYFNYLKKAEKAEGSFHNFLSFTEKALDAEGSEDSIGRAVWALGQTVKLSPDSSMRSEAETMLKRTQLEHHLEHPHVRTKAYILLGLLSAGDESLARIWANKLVDIFNEQSSSEWQWFEDSLRYANGILPYALSEVFLFTDKEIYLEIAKKSFDWLDSVSRIDGIPSPIGQNGWFYKGSQKAEYDQQPLEAADMVLAATSLYRATKENRYLDKAVEWMNWYHGHNIISKALVNPNTGGVYDAITPGHINENQGAESIVTYLLAYLTISQLIEK